MADANKIGSFQMMVVAGDVQEPGAAAERSERRGHDGAEYRQFGRRVAPSTLRTVVDLADAATCQTQYRAYRAAQNGDPVSVYDGHGLLWPSVVVRDVRLDAGAAPGGIQYCETPVGGVNGGSYLLHCVWTVESVHLP